MGTRGDLKITRGDEVGSPGAKPVGLTTEGAGKNGRVRTGTRGHAEEGVRNPTKEGLEGILEGVAEGEESRSQAWSLWHETGKYA